VIDHQRCHRKFSPLPLLALFGPAAISELSLLSGVKRKLAIGPANGRFWHFCDIRLYRAMFESGGKAEEICSG
jgi:hypothetical protein